MPQESGFSPRQLDQISFQVVMQLIAWLGLLLLIAPSMIILITSFSASPTLQFPPARIFTAVVYLSF